MDGFNMLGVRGRHDRVHAVRSRDAARLLGATPTASCWPTTSSRRCTARRSPSTCTRSPRSPTASSTTRPPAPTRIRAATATTRPSSRTQFRRRPDRRQDVKTIMKLEDHFTDDSGERSSRSPRTGRHPDLLQHQGPARRARAGRRQLEVLRDARHLDERAAGDQARAVRPDVEEGAGPRDDPDRPAERQPARGLVADPARGQPERASGRRREHLHRGELDRRST